MSGGVLDLLFLLNSHNLSCEQIVVLTFSLHAKFEEMIQIRCNKPKQCDLLIKDSIIHMDSLISLSTSPSLMGHVILLFLTANSCGLDF